VGCGSLRPLLYPVVETAYLGGYRVSYKRLELGGHVAS
jgi:hypothetical protein